ncbi:MAG: sulfotransferase domain-containing protein [Thermodesulfobacteriota bacterium]
MANAKLNEIIRKNPYLERPIFSFGSGRCGSTLFRSLVDGNAQVLVWPFEFSYYILGRNASKRFGKPCKTSELFEYYERLGVFQHIGTVYDGDLGSRKYSTGLIHAETFHKVIYSFASEELSRKEFLQLVIYAYQKSLKEIPEPECWFVTLNQPTAEPLLDFPQCKAIVLTRNPIDTYVSTKSFYFKGAELSGRDKCSVYRPGAANNRCRWGLLETAISPIFWTFEWLEKYRNDLGVLHLSLEDLRENPQKTMRRFAEFCGIQYSDVLICPTFLGQPHYSNLSSGKSSDGRIIPAKHERDYLENLTEFEFIWICSLFSNAAKAAGYSIPSEIPKLEAINRIAGFLKPMKHEFPESGQDRKWQKSRAVYLMVRLARWCFAPVGYLANRYLILNCRRILANSVYKGV